MISYFTKYKGHFLSYWNIAMNGIPILLVKKLQKTSHQFKKLQNFFFFEVLKLQFILVLDYNMGLWATYDG